MTPSLQPSPSRETIRVDEVPPLDLSELRQPNRERDIKATTDVEKREEHKPPEANPSHFAPENPTNRELAKERWYTRAAWTSVGVGYSAALASIVFAHGEVVTPSLTRGILFDTVFSYWALRNSEIRRFILEGSLLPHPVHGDKLIRTLLGIGAVSNFLASLSSFVTSLDQLLKHDYTATAITAASTLGSLHVGCAWLRRIKFFGALDAH